MRNLVRASRTLLRDCKGAAVVEYGLIIGLIVLAIMAAIVELGGTTRNMWNNVSDTVQRAH